MVVNDPKHRRDRHEIAAEILQSARFGVLRTHLMYKAKLSYGQLTEYVPMLLEKGLLENSTVVRRRQRKHFLRTTEKGAKFLENLRSLDMVWQTVV